MKIALITDDGETIGRHFGRAGHYRVVESEDGKEISREMHDKLGPSTSTTKANTTNTTTRVLPAPALSPTASP